MLAVEGGCCLLQKQPVAEYNSAKGKSHRPSPINCDRWGLLLSCFRCCGPLRRRMTTSLRMTWRLTTPCSTRCEGGYLGLDDYGI